MEHLFVLLKTFWMMLQHGQLPEVGQWNYLLLAILVAVEGPVATLLGGAAASTGLMRVWLVFIAAAVGNLTADTVWYLLGYSGKVDTLYKFARFLKLNPAHLDRLTEAMQEHSLKILFLAKLTAGFMIPSLLAAGLARIPWRRWFPVLLLGETIWTGSLILIGYHTTEMIKDVSRGVTYLILGISIGFLIFLVWEGRRILLKTPKFTEAIYGEDRK